MNEKDVIKDIESKIKRLNNSKVTEFHEKENLKDAFFNKLFIVDYTKENKKRLK